jgi:hypothetical protein
MTKSEATRIAKTYNKDPRMYATVERILPESIDPPIPNDDGWDVKVAYLPDFNNYED